MACLAVVSTAWVGETSAKHQIAMKKEARAGRKIEVMGIRTIKESQKRNLEQIAVKWNVRVNLSAIKRTDCGQVERPRESERHQKIRSRSNGTSA
jgi:hypothetical protein